MEPAEEDGVQGCCRRAEHDAAEEGAAVREGGEEFYDGSAGGVVLEERTWFLEAVTESVEYGYASDVVFQELEDGLERIVS